MSSLRNRNSNRTAKWYFATVFAILFVILFAQIHVAAHADEFGPYPHEHGGVPCAIQFLSEETKGLDVPQAVIVDAPLNFHAVEHFQTVAFWQPQSLTSV